MNRKGFTLIELIVTIALLAVVSIISFVSITGIIKDSKVKNCNNLVKSIKGAIRDYVSDNRYDNDFSVSNITISNISKYLDGNLVDPFTDEKINTDNITFDIILNNDSTLNNADILYDGHKINCNDGKL